MIHLLTVDIGERKIKIPVWEKQSPIPGKTIVITAGVDGDEYAGIEAAFQLINYYSTHQFSGRLIIIPIVNIPSFEEAVSYNPIDTKYPKYIYPGNKNGSSTEKLLYWLSTNYVSKANLWIDLHSGAIMERLNPFVRAYKTKNTSVNSVVKNILLEVRTNIKLYDQKYFKTDLLAKQNTAYIMLESGQLGERSKKDIDRHIKWVKKIIEVMQNNKIQRKQTVVYTKVNYYNATQDGLWYPNKLEKEIQKGTVLGEIFSFGGKNIQHLIVSQTGKLLWWRQSLNAKKGETMAAIVSEEDKI